MPTNNSSASSVGHLEQAFLDAIVANPWDFTPRLIFMDWLDEQDDPRGELLRLMHTLTQEIDPPNRPALETRLRGLLENGVQPVGPFWTNAIGMKFAWIAPGRFLMGSPSSELERRDDETQHKVTLTKGFFLGVHPVIQEQWQMVMENNPSQFQGENLPVEDVTWNDCQEFIKKLPEQDGKPYRLPTEAEWEYACRAGTTTPFYFGESISSDQANYDGHLIYGNGCKGTKRLKTTSVGIFQANGFGLHDMHGNINEWCEDWYADYVSSPQTDPRQTVEQSKRARMMRGGSWFNDPTVCRSAFRNYGGTELSRYCPGVVGFRIAFGLD